MLGSIGCWFKETWCTEHGASLNLGAALLDFIIPGPATTKGPRVLMATRSSFCWVNLTVLLQITVASCAGNSGFLLFWTRFLKISTSAAISAISVLSFTRQT